MKNHFLVTVTTLILCTACVTNSNVHLATQNPIDAYKEALIEKENSGGSLFCENPNGGETETYDSCVSFDNLREQGCYGRTTIDMIQEYHYATVCQEIQILEHANAAATSYFNLEADDWWESIPAEVIPMRGGIYSYESWEQQSIEHQNLVTGLSLGELDFVNVSVGSQTFEAILSSNDYDCGTINDYFSFQIVLIADLDGDGIAELFVKGSRSNRSESCLLGTGNNLGAGFLAIINLDDPLDTPSVIHISVLE